MARKAKTTRPVQKSGALGKLRARVRAQQDTIATVLEQNAEYQERLDVLDKELIELGGRHGKLNQEFGYLRDVNRQLNEQQKRLREKLLRATAALHGLTRFMAEQPAPVEVSSGDAAYDYGVTSNAVVDTAQGSNEHANRAGNGTASGDWRKRLYDGGKNKLLHLETEA